MTKVHNSRIQLLATALNNLGVGAILAGVIVPSVDAAAPPANVTHLLVRVVFGVILMAVTQLLLGRLR